MPSSSSWSLVVCGGGSGGHLFPALAIIEELRSRNIAPERVIFLTAERTIDRRILEEQQVEQHALNAVNSHQLLRKPVLSIQTMGRAVWQARQLLRTLPAPVVLGTGGFGSIPGILAARWRKCPIILLEQNIIPGRATSFLVRFAETVCLSFIETRKFLPESVNTELTGNPVRHSIARLTPASGTSKKRMLVLGGSQGAAAVNEAMLRFTKSDRERLSGWTIVHQTGEKDFEKVAQAYQALQQPAEVAPFFDRMAEIYSQSSFVITRAGGTSLAEIACAGLPAVVIPSPRSLRNHQRINAQHLVGRHAAILVEQGAERSMDVEMEKAIGLLMEDQSLRKSMGTAMRQIARPDAAQRVCDLIEAAFH